MFHWISFLDYFNKFIGCFCSILDRYLKLIFRWYWHNLLICVVNVFVTLHQDWSRFSTLVYLFILILLMHISYHYLLLFCIGKKPNENSWYNQIFINQRSSRWKQTVLFDQPHWNFVFYTFPRLQTVLIQLISNIRPLMALAGLLVEHIRRIMCTSFHLFSCFIDGSGTTDNRKAISI